MLLRDDSLSSIILFSIICFTVQIFSSIEAKALYVNDILNALLESDADKSSISFKRAYDPKISQSDNEPFDTEHIPHPSHNTRHDYDDSIDDVIINGISYVDGMGRRNKDDLQRGGEDDAIGMALINSRAIYGKDSLHTLTKHKIGPKNLHPKYIDNPMAETMYDDVVDLSDTEFEPDFTDFMPLAGPGTNDLDDRSIGDIISSVYNDISPNRASYPNVPLHKKISEIYDKDETVPITRNIIATDPTEGRRAYESTLEMKTLNTLPDLGRLIGDNRSKPKSRLIFPDSGDFYESVTAFEKSRYKLGDNYRYFSELGTSQVKTTTQTLPTTYHRDTVPVSVRYQFFGKPPTKNINLSLSYNGISMMDPSNSVLHDDDRRSSAFKYDPVKQYNSVLNYEKSHRDHPTYKQLIEEKDDNLRLENVIITTAKPKEIIEIDTATLTSVNKNTDIFKYHSNDNALIYTLPEYEDMTKIRPEPRPFNHVETTLLNAFLYRTSPRVIFSYFRRGNKN